MMRDPSTGSGQSASGLQYFLTDHLGSTVAITDSNGTLTSQQRYLPFGGTRTNVTTPNSPGTDFGYTGQRQLDAGMGGLMDYKARFYSPYLNRFIQPDTLIPDANNPQAWNRFSYVFNNPVRYNDPTGHCVEPVTGTACLVLVGVVVIAAVAVWTIAYINDPNVKNAADQIGHGVANAAKRWKDKNFPKENDIRIMEAEAPLTADQGRLPKDSKWCKNNPRRCGALIATVVTVLATVGFNNLKCGNDECPPEKNRLGKEMRVGYPPSKDMLSWDRKKELIPYTSPKPIKRLNWDKY